MSETDNILRGYTSIERPYKVEDYPWGFKLRTSIHYWIESKPKHGDRFCSYTIDPRTGRKCAPKCGTYYPFMYMFLDENGHVKQGVIDSYHRDIFKARFEFILNKIGIEYIAEVQQQNLRTNHYLHVKCNAPYEVAKYKDERKEEFKEWVKNTLTHIKTCEFKDLVSYPEKPVFDFPDN